MNTRLLILAFLAFSALPGFAELTAERLRTEGLNEPLVIDSAQPELSWALRARTGERNVSQIAYQVQAATTLDGLLSNHLDLWDSGQTSSQQPGRCQYGGHALQSAQRVYWHVRLWQVTGHPGPWSASDFFETGLLEQTDWTGPWIGMKSESRGQAAAYLRSTLAIDKPYVSARAYISGLGWSELYVNGQRIGDRALDPAQTDYNKRCFYVANDITAAAQKLGNPQKITVGVILGDGWFNQNRVWGGMSYGEPRLRAQFIFIHPDGTQTSIAANVKTWDCRTGPILNNNVYAGENFDARKELGDWSSPEAPRDGWTPAIEATPISTKMAPQTMPPVRCVRQISAKRCSELKTGTWIYDFGENVSGWEQIKILAEPGTQVHLRFAERLKPNGSLDASTGGPGATGCEQVDSYTAKGDTAGEVWHPRFTWHGFRYAELTIPSGHLLNPPSDKTVSLMVLHTDFEMTGKFNSSDQQLNHIHELAVRTMLANDEGVPSDCPIRERCGWTGDAQCVVKYELDNADASTFFRKYARDLQTGASEGGLEDTAGTQGFSGPAEHLVVPAGLPHMIAPGKRQCGFASPDWGCAVVFLPWQLYAETGDASVLTEFRGSMEKWTDWQLTRRAENGMLLNGLGDWCSPSMGPDLIQWIGTKEVPITSTAMLIRALSLLSQDEAITGDAPKSDYYLKLSHDLAAQWSDLFFQERDLATRSETALAFGVEYVPDPVQRAKIFATLLVKTANGTSFDTGIFGTPLMLKALSEGNRSDIARRLLTKPEEPSYGALWNEGATTLYEGWPKKNSDWSGSLSHPMQGGFDAWLYEDVAGLAGRSAGDAPWQFRWNHDSGLSSASAEKMSPLGPIRSSWTRSGENVTWNVSVPPGNRAEVSFPSSGSGTLNEIRESSKPIIGEPWLLSHTEDASGLKPRVKLGIGSGDYQFTFPDTGT